MSINKEQFFLNAVINGDLENVKELLAQGLNEKDLDKENGEFGFTPLIPAIAGGNKEIVQFLLEKNVNPNISDKERFTLLMRVIINKDEEMLQLLVGKISAAKEEIV